MNETGSFKVTEIYNDKYDSGEIKNDKPKQYLFQERNNQLFWHTFHLSFFGKFTLLK